MYKHDLLTHNLESPRQVLPLILKKLNIKSICDVGCGIGSWLKVASDLGINEFVGIDGDYIDKDMILVPTNNIIFADLNKVELIPINRKFDLVISLEVAEHLPKENAHSFVNFLTQLGDIVLFSAAIYNQGGQNHLNEQWPNYWNEIFEKNDYVLLDIIRFNFWDNKNVQWWYKQNMFLAVKKSIKDNVINMWQPENDFSPKAIVHPEQFLFYTEALNSIKNKDNYLRKILKALHICH